MCVCVCTRAFLLLLFVFSNTVQWCWALHNDIVMSELGAVGCGVSKYAEINETQSTDPWFYTSLSQSKVKLKKFSDKSFRTGSLSVLLLSYLVS